MNKPDYLEMTRQFTDSEIEAIHMAILMDSAYFQGYLDGANDTPEEARRRMEVKHERLYNQN